MDAATDAEEACDRLLARVATGDRLALEEIFRIEAGRLLAVARRIVRRPDLAEEVVQEAFVAIWRRAGLFDTARGRARAWMTTIVRNRALNMLRDGARLDFVDEADIAIFADRASEAEAAYDALPQTELLRRCLDQLEPRRRKSIVLAYVVGFTHGEIAADLKAPVGTVKAWIRRGVVALKECMS